MNDLEISFIASLRKSSLKGELSNSLKQASIRLIGKEDKDRDHYLCLFIVCLFIILVLVYPKLETIIFVNYRYENYFKING